MPNERNLDLLASTLDVNGALGRLGDDVELLEQIILIFLEDAPTLVHTSRQSLAQGEMPELRRAAHSVKGMMATLGATAGVNAAFRLEQCAAAGNADEASALIHEVRRARRRAYARCLQAYMESGAEVGVHDSIGSRT